MEDSLFSNRNMRYLISIYNNRSISKAAKELYISQPALSRFLISFEERLGMPLFDKIGYTLIPTYVGDRFMHYAMETRRLEQELAHELDDLLLELRGRLRLALPLMRSPFLLPVIVPQFCALYPNVNLEITEVQSDMLEPLILENKVDFALANRELLHPRLEQIRIYNDQIFLAVPRGNATAHKLYTMYNGKVPPVDITLFKDEKFVLLTKGQQLRDVADKIFAEKGIVPNVVFTSRNNQSALNLCASGFSSCIFAATYLRPELQEKMYIFPIDSQYQSVDINLVYWKNLYMPQYFKTFIEIVEHLRDSGLSSEG